jgi:hypothetical protein
MDAITKNAVVSARILAHVQRGSTLPEAVDAVLGGGTYAAVVGNIYDALTAKQG